MSTDTPETPSDENVLPSDIAQRVLSRAIELDAEGPGMTLRELRTIAREVGVSPAKSSTWLSRLRYRWRAWRKTSNPTDAGEFLPPSFWRSVLLNVLAISTVWIVVGL